MNKYRNKPCRALGYTFRSKKERDYAIFLESEKTAGRIYDWEYEKPYPLFASLNDKREILLKSKRVAIHYPDFTVLGKDGQEVHEVKSKATKTAVWALKKKIFTSNYPKIKYIVLDS